VNLKVQCLDEGGAELVAIAMGEGLPILVRPLLVPPKKIFLVNDAGAEVILVYSLTCLYYAFSGVVFHTEEDHERCRTWTPAGCRCDVEEGR